MKPRNPWSLFVEPVGEFSNGLVASFPGHVNNRGELYGHLFYEVDYITLRGLFNTRQGNNVLVFNTYIDLGNEKLIHIEPLLHNKNKVPETEAELLAIIQGKKGKKPALGEIWSQGKDYYYVIEGKYLPRLFMLPVALTIIGRYSITKVDNLSGDLICLRVNLCGVLNQQRPVDSTMLDGEFGWIRIGKARQKFVKKKKK
ncbi:MAG: hypothetical protein WC858_01620 [Parcubacteria group bacterium]|jgi:hypothetical protein